ncbi:MAG: hypothetical protein BGO95_07945 [Micrococcales bacterium 73-13]|nr:MAG: hypothetical protein BGO95_07945 [Micrococcales bacterium 73-13]
MASAYCTYFDSGYLSRGLTLIESLRRHGDESPVWILALDEEVAGRIDALDLPGVRLVGISAIEAMFPELPGLKAQRTRMEYYFTMTPLLIQYVMAAAPGSDVAYLDADLCYFADPSLVWSAMGGGSIGIIEHRYQPAFAKRLAKYGTYNVGWVGFRDDARGRACLRWWGERTVEWCSDTPSEGRYADQGYLDWFPRDFEGVTVLPHVGMDAAPWNSARYTWTSADDRVAVDGEPLVFFHAHGVRRVGHWWVTAQLQYRAPMGRVLRDRVYEPYVRGLERWEARIPAPPRTAPRGTGLRGLAFRITKTMLNAVSILTGNAVRAA